MADAQPALTLEHVTRRFGDVTALGDLSLRVSQGEVVGLLGHNGAGKTTTVRLLAGLLAADAGSVRVGDADPMTDGPAVRQRLGVLPANPVVDDRLTGRQNLVFAADVFAVPRDGLDARIDAALAGFELTQRGDERVAGYSTGMRQRLALARVMLSDPEVLLLDEPTSALDPIAARQVRRSLADMAQVARRTVVLCTHDLSEAEQLCDRVIVLERGRVVADGSPADLAAEHGTGGVLVEVAADDVEVARRALAALHPTSLEVAGAGRVRAGGVPRNAVPALVAALAADGVAVYEVRRLDPTLEDVYLALHGRSRPPATPLPSDPGDSAGEVTS